MAEKLRLSTPVIVEGKYDKIKLEALVDGVILTTNGFGIYRDKELQQTVRALAKSCGVVVLTDSDAAGFRIRSFIKSIAAGGEVVHVYAPDLFGKERRKAAPSKEGKLGVEGIGVEELRRAFARAGVAVEGGDAPAPEHITRGQLYQDGFTGGKDSGERRRALLARLGLPRRLSLNSALPLLNRLLSLEEYRALVAELDREEP